MRANLGLCERQSNWPTAVSVFLLAQCDISGPSLDQVTSHPELGCLYKSNSNNKLFFVINSSYQSGSHSVGEFATGTGGQLAIQVGTSNIIPDTTQQLG